MNFDELKQKVVEGIELTSDERSWLANHFPLLHSTMLERGVTDLWLIEQVELKLTLDAAIRMTE